MACARQAAPAAIREAELPFSFPKELQNSFLEQIPPLGGREKKTAEKVEKGRSSLVYTPHLQRK
jgi:hypothetical protein